MLVAGLLICNPAWAVDSLENSLGMRFIQIPAGSFTMGTVEVEAVRMEFPEPGPDDVLDETPAHTVRISEPFYLGETEVTQGVWYRVMQNRPGEGFAKVRRGGSYHCPIHLLRPGYRAANKPGIAYSVQGFRLVAELKRAR